MFNFISTRKSRDWAKSSRYNALEYPFKQRNYIRIPSFSTLTVELATVYVHTNNKSVVYKQWNYFITSALNLCSLCIIRKCPVVRIYSLCHWQEYRSNRCCHFYANRIYSSNADIHASIRKWICYIEEMYACIISITFRTFLRDKQSISYFFLATTHMG